MRQAFTDDIGGFCIGVCAARSVPRLQYFRIAVIPIAVIPCTPFCSVIVAAWVQELSRLQYLRIAVISCEYLLVCDSWCMDPRFQYLRIAVRDSLHAFLHVLRLRGFRLSADKPAMSPRPFFTWE